MATHRFDSASQFRAALALRVPKTLRGLGGRIYFDATSQLHEQLTLTTRVDTGYLRASLGATVAKGASFNAKLPTRRATAGPGAFVGLANEAAQRVGEGLAEAARGLAPITIGYSAAYAPYVEDRYHTMKRAVAQWRRFNAIAIANARDLVRGAA